MPATMDSELKEALSGEMTPKFLATADAAGEPNIVPVISIEPWDSETLIFGDLMLRKTKANLTHNAPVSVGVMTPDGKSWSVRGRFQGFERTGPKFDKVSGHDMYRYNSYSGLRAAGIIAIEETSPPKKIDIPNLAAGAIWVTFRRGVGAVALSDDGPMPRQVVEKFARMKAAKFMSWLDEEGFPAAASCMSLFPVGPGQLAVAANELAPVVSNPAFLRGPVSLPGGVPPAGTRVAAAIITFDPVAYQVKGVISKYKDYLGTKVARIDVDEVYAASPPLPGHRIA